MDTANIIGLVMVLIAILTLLWQTRISNQLAKMQIFMTYTQRYQDIIINLPICIDSESFVLSENKDEREIILRWFRAYFNLCSEEYYLNQNNKLEKKVWSLWESGIIASLKKPAFIQAWGVLQEKKYFDSEFIKYVKDNIE